MLVDSSARVGYLRSGEGALAAALEGLPDENRAALCGLVLTEVRQGLRPPEEGGVLELFATLPYLETTRGDYERAGALLAGLRRRGVTVPTPDGVVAALCLGRGLALLESDRHFDGIDGLERFPWRGP